MKPQEPQQSRPRVLAADDDPIMRELMVSQLSELMDVVVAENGQIAWEMLADQRFDLAIIDLGMPELDGFGLIQHLRQTPRTVDLPIIVATSRGDQAAIETAFASGASGFVTKPINWSLFKYNVQFVMKSGQTERQLRQAQTLTNIETSSKNNLLAFLLAQMEKAEKTTPPRLDNELLAEATLLSRLALGDIKPSPTSANLNTLIAQIEEICTPLANEKSVRFIARRSLADISLMIDPGLWKTALVRLVKRSIQSAPPGGTVEILVGGQRDGSLVMTVRDNGPIIPASRIQRELSILTAPVKQFISDVETIGLNLPVIRKIAELHDGKALFQNKQGEGNISALWLPATRVEIAHLEEAG